MRPEDIRIHARRAPFRPFRLYMSSGASYDVPHPEFITVGETQVVIAAGTTADGVEERYIYCAPGHVTHLEHLSSERAAESTG